MRRCPLPTQQSTEPNLSVFWAKSFNQASLFLFEKSFTKLSITVMFYRFQHDTLVHEWDDWQLQRWHATSPSSSHSRPTESNKRIRNPDNICSFNTNDFFSFSTYNERLLLGVHFKDAIQVNTLSDCAVLSQKYNQKSEQLRHKWNIGALTGLKGITKTRTYSMCSQRTMRMDGVMHIGYRFRTESRVFIRKFAEKFRLDNSNSKLDRRQ